MCEYESDISRFGLNVTGTVLHTLYTGICHSVLVAIEESVTVYRKIQKFDTPGQIFKEILPLEVLNLEQNRIECIFLHRQHIVR